MASAIYEEVFVSREYPTQEEAETKLAAVREFFSEETGWKEKDGGTERLANGKWRAVRKHIKYA